MQICYCKTAIRGGGEYLLENCHACPQDNKLCECNCKGTFIDFFALQGLAIIFFAVIFAPCSCMLYMFPYAVQCSGLKSPVHLCHASFLELCREGEETSCVCTSFFQGSCSLYCTVALQHVFIDFLVIQGLLSVSSLTVYANMAGSKPHHIHRIYVSCVKFCHVGFLRF